MLSVFAAAFSAVVFPRDHVITRTWMSGCITANIRASASSLPVSTSRRIW
jgi:hypothetical protein